MTDRELLEAAARACRHQVLGWIERDDADFMSWGVQIEDQDEFDPWNSLTSSYDAFELECVLSMDVLWGMDRVTVEADGAAPTEHFSDHNGDKQVARRRASTRAAAAVACHRTPA